jgi:hypothetical protein
VSPQIAVPAGLDFCAHVDVTGLGEERPDGLGDVTGLADAVRSAREHGGVCYLEDRGVQVAAIVPVR